MSEKRNNRKKRSVKRKAVFFTALILSVSMIVTGAAVFAKSMTTTTQRLETGVVDIEVESPTEKIGGILPGQRVFFAPTVANKGYDCYVRAWFEFSDYRDCFKIFHDTGNWVYCAKDGFWYDKSILETGCSTAVFDGFKVSSDLPEESEGKQVFLRVKAEAVQAENFAPDFESEEPWGAVEAEALEKNKMYTVDQEGIKDAGLSVVYEGDADKLLTTSSDFFENLPTVMPGDIYEQSIELDNRYGQNAELYFYSFCEDKNDITDQILLTIRSSLTGTVYEGPLRATKIDGEQNAVNLGSIPANGKGTMTFTLTVPSELDNAYVLGKSQVQWVFTTEKTVPKAAGRQINKAIDTGDENDLGFMLAVIGCAALAMLFLIRKKMEFTTKDKKE